MSKLTFVRNALETNPNVIIVDVEYKNNLGKRQGPSWWDHTIDFRIAPKNRLYRADELQAFMTGLIPLKPTSKDDFRETSYTHKGIKFGKLYFDERIEDDELKTLMVAVAEVRRASKKEGYQRRIWVSPYPDEWIARASLKDELFSPTHEIKLKDIKKYQPGYEPSHLELLTAKMKEIEAKRRRLIYPFAMQFIDSAMRTKWKMDTYKKDLLFTLVITDKCTLRCEHCFEEAGPEKNTFLDKDRVDKVLEESGGLFKNYKDRTIRVTGGDPFLHPNLFEIIKSFSKRKNKLGYSGLDVETNGWWATDDEKTREMVLKLKETGADLLSMTVDYWHCKGDKFDNYEHSNRINKIAAEVNFKFRNINLGMPVAEEDDEWVPETVPIGRGRNLPEKYWGEHICCKADGCRLHPPTLCRFMGEYVHTDEITIEPNGNVYPCNSGKTFEHATLSLGNIYQESLPKIVEEEDNPIVRLLREKGLRALSKKAGFSLRKHWEMYDKFSPCGMCHEILRVHGKKISA